MTLRAFLEERLRQQAQERKGMDPFEGELIDTFWFEQTDPPVSFMDVRSMIVEWIETLEGGTRIHEFVGNGVLYKNTSGTELLINYSTHEEMIIISQATFPSLT